MKLCLRPYEEDEYDDKYYDENEDDDDDDDDDGDGELSGWGGELADKSLFVSFVQFRCQSRFHISACFAF